MGDNKDLIDKFYKEYEALFKALDKTKEDFEDYLTKENKMEDNKDLIDKFPKEDGALFKALDKAKKNKRISKFIVRGLINGEWETLVIVLSYSIAEARLKALKVFADPLIVMDLTLWTHSDDAVKRNIEEIALTAYKGKKRSKRRLR